VRDPVATYAGTNALTIDSYFGAFDSNVNQMLMRRVPIARFVSGALPKFWPTLPLRLKNHDVSF
jgi:hypothetical protein